MAGTNPNQVYAPTPDQSTTTGAVAVATTASQATAANVPNDARTALTSVWNSGGYVSEDGMSLSISKTFNDIHDWSHSTVKSVLTEYKGQISVSFLQVDEFAAKRVFGESNVTVTAANATHGQILNIAIGAELPPIEAYCFSMKDGNQRVRVYVPRGQFTEIADMAFTTDGVKVGGTLATYDDGTGHSIYVIFDDGQVVSG